MKIGGVNINNLKIGNTTVNEVFIGTNKIFPNTISEYIFKINTALGNGNDTFQFTVPSGGTKDFDINFGDGTQVNNVTSHADSRLNHSYSSGGVYTIKVNIRDLKSYVIGQGSDGLKYIDIVNWGDNSTLTSLIFLFKGANNLTSISATDSPNLTNCTTFREFMRSSPLNADLSGWDFSSGINFQLACLGATGLNSSLGNNVFSSMTIGNSVFQSVSSNTSSLANLTIGGNVSYFFYFAQNFAYNTLTNVDFSAVTNATGFFQNSDLNNSEYQNFLVDLTGWNGTTATKTLQSNVPFHFGTAKYAIGGASEDVRTYLTSTKGWTITDGGGI